MNVKEVIAAALKRVAGEYTRLDRRCNGCRRESFGGEGYGSEYFCKDCYERLPWNDKFICGHCGRSVTAATPMCDDCVGYETSFDMARSPFYYAPPIDKMVRWQKFYDRKYLSKVFAVFLARTYVRFFSDADVITFCPADPATLAKLGYNQSELMAKRLAEIVGTPCEELVFKTNNTDLQACLGRDERLENLKGSMTVPSNVDVKDKTVVIVDDVMTTGATVDITSRALKKAGAKTVYVLTAASVTDKKTALALGQERSHFTR